jgi:hypothetical protein
MFYICILSLISVLSFLKCLSSISDPGIFKLNVIQQVKRSQAAARFEPLITGL